MANNILIISFEGKNVKTEEIYFTNKRNNDKCSFKKDKKLLEVLGINDVFFLSFNINQTKDSISKKLDRLLKLNPSLKECYAICDRDTHSISDDQISEGFQKFSEIILKKFSGIIVTHLQYKKSGQKFEDFLRMHFKDRKIYSGYSKTAKDLYEKVMGINGKNLKCLLSNISYIDEGNGFKTLFTTREKEQFD